MYTMAATAMSTVSMSIFSVYMTMLDQKFVVTALKLNMFSTFIILSIINSYPVTEEPELKLNKLHEDQVFLKFLENIFWLALKLR